MEKIRNSALKIFNSEALGGLGGVSVQKACTETKNQQA